VFSTPWTLHLKHEVAYKDPARAIHPDRHFLMATTLTPLRLTPLISGDYLVPWEASMRQSRPWAAVPQLLNVRREWASSREPRKIFKIFSTRQESHRPFIEAGKGMRRPNHCIEGEIRATYHIPIVLDYAAAGTWLQGKGQHPAPCTFTASTLSCDCRSPVLAILFCHERKREIRFRCFIERDRRTASTSLTRKS